MTVVLHPIEAPETGASTHDLTWRAPAGVSVGEEAAFVSGVFQATLALYRRSPRPAPWLGYFSSDPAGFLVGCGGFVGAPDAEGRVEIAYGTSPTFERRGYGLATARALVGLALACDPAVRIIAHTLPRMGPSPRILEKAGFGRVGLVDHPEDGPVWLWERLKPGAALAAGGAAP